MKNYWINLYCCRIRFLLGPKESIFWSLLPFLLIGLSGCGDSPGRFGENEYLYDEQFSEPFDESPIYEYNSDTAQKIASMQARLDEEKRLLVIYQGAIAELRLLTEDLNKVIRNHGAGREQFMKNFDSIYESARQDLDYYRGQESKASNAETLSYRYYDMVQLYEWKLETVVSLQDRYNQHSNQGFRGFGSN